MKYLLTITALSLTLGGCGTVNNALSTKTKTVEYYRIFDIKTQADRNLVADSASNGLGKNTSSANESRPIPTSNTPPHKPGRFSLTNPFEGTKLAAFASASGASGFKVAICKDAAWSANANRNITGQSNLKLTACLFQYTQGYHLDLYATFTKQQGGLKELGRQAAAKMVGTPEQWTEKTFLDIVRQIRADTGAEIKLLEGYPKQQGTPWMDRG